MPLKSISEMSLSMQALSSMLRRQDFTELFLTKSCACPQLLFACEDDNESEFLFFFFSQPENLDENSNVVAANHLACSQVPIDSLVIPVASSVMELSES